MSAVVVVFAAAAAADVGALIENARMQMLFCVMQFLKMFPERERERSILRCRWWTEGVIIIVVHTTLFNFKDDNVFICTRNLSFSEFFVRRCERFHRSSSHVCALAACTFIITNQLVAMTANVPQPNIE